MVFSFEFTWLYLNIKNCQNLDSVLIEIVFLRKQNVIVVFFNLLQKLVFFDLQISVEAKTDERIAVGNKLVDKIVKTFLPEDLELFCFDVDDGVVEIVKHRVIANEV